MGNTRVRKPANVLLVMLGCVAVSTGARASDLQVVAGAKKAGSFGLEVTVGSTCSSDADLVVPDQTVGSTTTFEGCLTVTAANVDVTSAGDLTLQAGEKVTLQNGFSVAASGNLTVAIDYVQDDSPAAEKLYRARFYVDVSSLSPGSGDSFDHFTAYANSGATQFEIQLEENGSNIDLVVSARDGGTFSTATASSSLPGTYLAVEFEWMASAAGQSNGHLDVWLDGSPVTGLANLDNETGQIDYVRWGAVDGVDSTTTGTMNLDEFVSQRSSSMIGTLP
jgi:hypothetical protein